MTQAQLDKLLNGLARPIVETIRTALDVRFGPVEARLAALEAAHAALESKALKGAVATRHYVRRE